MSRGARWTVIAFLLFFTWMMLSGWSADTRTQRVWDAGIAAFMLVLALGLASPKRFILALRVVAGTIAVVYLGYFVWELFKLLGGERQPLALNRPNATAAGVGLLIYGVPALIFALGAERVGVSRLLRSPSGDNREEEENPPEGDSSPSENSSA